MRRFLVSIAVTMSLLFLVACGGGSANDESGNSQIKNEPDETDTALQLKKLPGTLIIVGDSIMAGCAAPLISRFDYEHRTTSEGATFEDYRQIVRDISAAGHCALVDTSQWFNATDIYDECSMPDTLHLGEDGHILYSKNLLEEIREDYSTL